jgi:type VI secretion system secreted protein Hcp
MPTDSFLKIDSIKGESADDKHKDEIEVLSFSWAVNNGGSMGHGGGGGEGKATFQDLTFEHNVDKASAPLLLACATGTHLKEATITTRKSGKGQLDYMTIKMKDVIVTAVNPANHQGASLTESVSLSYAIVNVEYKPQKADGSLDAGIFFKYNVKAQKEE